MGVQAIDQTAEAVSTLKRNAAEDRDALRTLKARIARVLDAEDSATAGMMAEVGRATVHRKLTDVAIDKLREDFAHLRTRWAQTVARLVELEQQVAALAAVVGKGRKGGRTNGR
jgi:hypothetical protein